MLQVGFGALLWSLSDFANQTIFICVGACFLVLVGVTLNLVVALYATLTVALVIGGVMGMIIAAGMKVPSTLRASVVQCPHARPA